MSSFDIVVYDMLHVVLLYEREYDIIRRTITTQNSHSILLFHIICRFGVEFSASWPGIFPSYVVTLLDCNDTSSNIVEFLDKIWHYFPGFFGLLLSIFSSQCNCVITANSVCVHRTSMVGSIIPTTVSFRFNSENPTSR